MPRLKKIVESLPVPRQKELGYNPAEEGESTSLKAVLNTLQFAHRQRTVAHENLARYPNTVFKYYRADSATQLITQRKCEILYITVEDGTEMMELPCHHVFAVKAIYDMLTHSQHAAVETWGCPVCRQGQIKAVSDWTGQRQLKTAT